MKLRRVTKVAGAIALATGLALGAAACSGGDNNTKDSSSESNNSSSKADAKASVAASLETMREETYSAQMSMGEFGSGTFDVDLANKKQRATLEMDGTRLGAGGGKTEMEMIVIDTDVWVKLGGEAARGMEGKWLHTTAEDMGKDMSSMNMQSMTDEMMKSLDNVKETGENTYTATMDMSSVAQATGGQSGNEPLEVEIELDDKDRLKKLEFVMPVETGDVKEIPFSLEVTEYGAPVKVEAPDKSEVTEMP